MEITLKRTYDAPDAQDGLRILVDGMWPRGISKQRLAADIWARQIAPGPALRQSLHSNPDANWPAFRTAYRGQLEASTAFAQLCEQIATLSPTRITLLYAYRDETRNNALVVREALEKRLNP